MVLLFSSLFSSSNNFLSFLFYISIALLSSFFAGLSTRCKSTDTSKSTYPSKYLKTCKNKKPFSMVMFVISFLILWLPAIITTNGADRPNYSFIFQNIKASSLLDWWIEPGFSLINLILSFVSSSPTIILALLSTITLVLIYQTLYYFRNKIDIGIAVFLFACVFYFQSYSLMRIYLAASILFFGLRFAVDGDYCKYMITVLIAFFIHYSSLALFLIFLVVFLFDRLNFDPKALQYILIPLFILSIFSVWLFSNYLVNLNIFARYEHYFENISSQSLGIMQFIYWIPVCLILQVVLNRSNNVRIKRLAVIFTYFGFFLGVLGYLIPFVGRFSILFNVPFVFVVPYAMQLLNSDITVNKTGDYKVYRDYRKIIQPIATIAIFIYGIFRLTIYLNEYSVLDKILPYTTFWME